MKKIPLIFNGYWTDEAKAHVPNQSGIYCVYGGTDNGETVSINRLIYIGESVRVGDRLNGHERYSDWLKNAGLIETLIYTFAPILNDRERAEAALIYQHKPKENTSCVDYFPHEETQISVSGKIALLTPSFTVEDQSAFKSLYGLFNRYQPR